MGPMKAKRKPKPSRITTSKSSAETEKRQRKVQIFLEGHKNLAHLPLLIWRYQEMQKKLEDGRRIFVASTEYVKF